MSIFANELAEIGLPDPVLAAESVITSERMSVPMKLACWLASEGTSYQDAADLVGVHPRHLHRVAKRHGITRVHDLRQIERARILDGLEVVQRSAQIADLAPEHLVKLV